MRSTPFTCPAFDVPSANVIVTLKLELLTTLGAGGSSGGGGATSTGAGSAATGGGSGAGSGFFLAKAGDEAPINASARRADRDRKRAGEGMRRLRLRS